MYFTFEPFVDNIELLTLKRVEKCPFPKLLLLPSSFSLSFVQPHKLLF